MITLLFRIILIVFSLGTAVYMLKRIRQANLQIEHAVFWLIFAAILVLLSLFPHLALAGARVLGIYSSTNFIFLIMFFLLIIKSFSMTIEISRLEYKLRVLAQSAEIKDHEAKEHEAQEKKRKENILEA